MRRMKKSTSFSANAGLSLTEIIFTALILSISTLSMIIPYSLSQQLVIYSKNRIQASNLSLARTEQVLSAGYDSINTGTTTENSVTLDPVGSGNGPTLATRATTVTQNSGETIKTINVTVSWSETVLGRSVAASESITAYITRK